MTDNKIPIATLTKEIEPSFLTWQKRINDKKFDEADKEIIDSSIADDTALFLKQISSHLDVPNTFTSWTESWNTNLPDMMNKGDFLNPSQDTEKYYYKIWQDLPPNLTRLPEFWAICHLAMIEQNVISPSFLHPEPDNDDHFTLSRLLLYRMGGYHREGNRSTFTNCPTARGWWRTYLAHEASELYQAISIDEAHQVLHSSYTNWENLITYSMKKLVVLSDPIIRAAIIAHLVANTISTEKFKLLLERIAQLSIGRHFYTMGVEKCVELVESAASDVSKLIVPKTPQSQKKTKPRKKKKK